MGFDLISYNMGLANGSKGGSAVAEYYTPEVNQDVVSSMQGKIVRIGNRAFFYGAVWYASASGATRLVFTIPSAIRPAGYYTFITGNGAATTTGSGYVMPTGEVYIVTSSSRAYDYFAVEWDVPETKVDIVGASYVTEVIGKICVAGKSASMSLKVTANPATANWQNGILTIPSEIRPLSAIGVFVSEAAGSNKIKDTSYTEAAGEINIWLPRGSQDFRVQAAWIIGE